MQTACFRAYRVLRTTNPSPYMVFLSVDGDEIMCSSPETLVRLQDGRLTTFPVAGSRPRGKDRRRRTRRSNGELLADEKELSEHNMLVDLGRNDLGRVSKIGTVEVTDYMMIHRYSKIMHICSQVEGDIDEKYDACDAIEAVLPAGTLSGAPKIRACEIIEEQESEPRGVYGGALGYLDFTGNMDTCIAIRMAAKKNGIVTVQAGGGIVADSVPYNEYMESANKAKRSYERHRACIGGRRIMILLIDNYDSFSYNLYPAGGGHRAGNASVVRNDALTVSEIEGSEPLAHHPLAGSRLCRRMPASARRW